MLPNVADDWVTKTVEDLTVWAGARAEKFDLHGAQILLELAREELELGGPGELDAEELHDLMVEVFPDVVDAGPEDVPAVLGTARGLVEFLADTGVVGAAQAGSLRAELAGIEPEFAEAVEQAAGDDEHDAYQILVAMMTDEGVDLEDEAAVESWVQAFEALSEQEQAARTLPYILDQLDDGAMVAPVRLAPVAELAAAARASRLFTAADTGDDEAVLAAWLEGFDARTACEHGEEELSDEEIIRHELPGILLFLYEGEEPAALEDLSEALLEELLQAEHIEDPAAWRRVGPGILERELAAFVEDGVVARTDGGRLELTPLGVWGVREMLLADGYTAPLVGELAGESAEALVIGLTWHREDTADEEIDLWLGRREPGEAAGELVELMRSGTPGQRNLAAAVLHRVDVPAAPVVRAALDDPTTRPYAVIWLNEHGDTGVELAPEEMAWIFIDTVAGLLETSEPAEAIEEALAGSPDLRSMIEGLWRIDHPAAVDVLDALGDHHPDKKVGKIARTAAYKARSARGAG